MASDTAEFEARAFREVEADLLACHQHDLLFKPDPSHASIWNERFIKERARFVSDELALDQQALAAFRRDRIFISDNPTFPLTQQYLEQPEGQYENQLGKNLLQILHKHESLELLEKYPVPDVGHPNCFHYGINGKRFYYTHRWAKHIHSLGLFNRHLRPLLDNGFTSLDIGSSFGIFQYLLHREHPGCHQVLVDLPEQLLLARYFLRTTTPEARIAGVTEIMANEGIDRDFLNAYDFVLLPAQLYSRMQADTLDLISSFACIGELSRELFRGYVEHPVFQTARCRFLINPVAPAPDTHHSGETDICILDYPFHEWGRRIHFAVSPIYIHAYGFRPGKFPPFFEYIGEA